MERCVLGKEATREGLGLAWLRGRLALDKVPENLAMNFVDMDQPRFIGYIKKFSRQTGATAI